MLTQLAQRRRYGEGERSGCSAELGSGALLRVLLILLLLRLLVLVLLLLWLLWLLLVLLDLLLLSRRRSIGGRGSVWLLLALLEGRRGGSGVLHDYLSCRCRM